MSLVKDYTAEDLQNALDRGRTIGREEAYADLEQENRLLRARCERLQGELDTAEQANHELEDQLRVEKLSHKDMANVLNNYEELIQKQRTWVGLTDEERVEMWKNYNPLHGMSQFMRQIEAKLKGKNT